MRFLTLSRAERVSLVPSHHWLAARCDSRKAVNQYRLEASPPAMKLAMPCDISHFVLSHRLNIRLKTSKPGPSAMYVLHRPPAQTSECLGRVGRTPEHGCETAAVDKTRSYAFPHPR